MKRTLITLAAGGTLLVAGCSGSEGKCREVPSSFFTDIGVRGEVMKSGAVKSSVQTVNGHDIYEVAARFSDGSVAVWSTGSSIVGGGPTYPMNDAAKAHSDQGVDAPSSALPDDPDGVVSAEACV